MLLFPTTSVMVHFPMMASTSSSTPRIGFLLQLWLLAILYVLVRCFATYLVGASIVFNLFKNSAGSCTLLTNTAANCDSNINHMLIFLLRVHLDLSAGYLLKLLDMGTAHSDNLSHKLVVDKHCELFFVIILLLRFWILLESVHNFDNSLLHIVESPFKTANSLFPPETLDMLRPFTPHEHIIVLL